MTQLPELPSRNSINQFFLLTGLWVVLHVSAFTTDQAYSNQAAWAAFANTNDGFGTWLETNPAGGTRSFVDDQSTNSTLAPPASGQRSVPFVQAASDWTHSIKTMLFVFVLL